MFVASFLYLHFDPVASPIATIANIERMRVTLQHIRKNFDFPPPLFKGLELLVGLGSVDESFTKTHGNLSSISNESFSSQHKGLSAICEFSKEQTTSTWQRELLKLWWSGSLSNSFLSFCKWSITNAPAINLRGD